MIACLFGINRGVWEVCKAIPLSPSTNQTLNSQGLGSFSMVSSPSFPWTLTQGMGSTIHCRPLNLEELSGFWLAEVTASACTRSAWRCCMWTSQNSLASLESRLPICLTSLALIWVQEDLFMTFFKDYLFFSISVMATSYTLPILTFGLQTVSYHNGLNEEMVSLRHKSLHTPLTPAFL